MSAIPLSHVTTVIRTLVAKLVLVVACGFGGLPGADAIPGLRATASSSPPRIVLNWSGSGSRAIYRSAGVAMPAGGGSPSTSWGSAIATITGTTWTDTSVALGGQGYEYKVVDTATGNVGYVYAGVEIPVVDNRGAIVLVIEESLTEPLTFELDRLGKDLVGDGYRVLRAVVSRTDAPSSVRSRLQALRSANADMKTAFLIGHVPVQRSGWMNPDGHFSRCFPTDSYYADLDGTWTDTSVNNDVRSNNVSVHRNVLGDGYTDQTYLPSDTDLEVGRVDFADMRTFLPMTEVDLMRQYLNRDHAWRTGQLPVAFRSANMNGRPDQFQGQLFATASPVTITGSGIPNPTFWADAETNDYLLFTKGGGGGFYNGTSGVGSTTDYSQSPGVKVLINAQSASYYGEWDVENAYLRAPLAAKGLGLISFYYELPTWILHHLGSGGTIGRAAQISQNNNGYYDNSYQVWGMSNSRRVIHIALHGDPTLRIHVVKPPTAVRSTSSGVVSWTASGESGVAGYHVYRAATAAGPFQRITTSPVNSTQFTDPAPPGGAKRYLVRATVLESRGGSGSYWNSSVGILDDQGPRMVVAQPDTRNSITVTFDRPLQSASAQNVANYQVTGGISLSSAILQSDQRTVALSTSAHSSGGIYSLTATGILATGSTPVAGSTSVSYGYQEATELGNDAATIALYHLDGNGLDSSGHGYHLALGSGVTFVGGSPYGAQHRCLKVSGADAAGTQRAAVTIPDAAVLPSATPLTFEASLWVDGYTASGLMDAHILTFGQDVWNGTKLQMMMEGRWGVAGNEYRSATSTCSGATLLSYADSYKRIIPRRWTRLAMEYDGSTSAYLYLDGVRIAGPVTVTNYVGSTTAWSLVLGNFVGCIDEVRISSVRRSQSTPVLPAAPGNVVATAGNAQASLGWSSVSGATSYRIQRSSSASGPFTTIVSSLNGTTHVDSGLTNGATYYYVVAATNAAGTGANSAVVSATPSAPPALPAAPAGLTANAGNAQVMLAWNVVSGASSYRVQQGTSASGPFATIATGVTGTTYAATGLTNGTAYYFAVAATNTAGTGANSAAVMGQPQDPGGNGDEFEADAETIALWHFTGSYSDASSHGFTLVPTGSVALVSDNLGWMATPSGQAVRFTGLGATLSVQIPDTVLLPRPGMTPVTIEARIYVRNYSAYGIQNAPILAVTQAWDSGFQVVDGKWNSPKAPTVSIGSNGSVVSSTVWDSRMTRNAWHDLSIAQTGDGSVTISIDGEIIGSAVVSHNVGRTNPWTVTLGNFDGYMDEIRISSIERAANPLPPVAPAGLVASAGNASVDLGWSSVSGANAYVVKRASTIGGPYQVIADPVSGTSYVDSGLTNGMIYFYVVAARNAVGSSSDSASVSATPMAPSSGGDEYIPDAATMALYHFTNDYSDSGTNAFTLVPTGGVSLVSDNVAWMSSPSGRAVRFSGHGATLSVAIPDAQVFPGPGLAPLTLDARIYVRNYSAYGIDNAPIVSLTQSWDTGLGVLDGKWNNPKAPTAHAGKTGGIVSSATWDAVVTRNVWHALRIVQEANGTVTVSIDGIAIGSAVVTQNTGRTNDWTFILGNFGGDIDEVRIQRQALGGPAG